MVNTEKKISASKSKVLVASRRPVNCNIRVHGESLTQEEKVKYLGIYFTTDGRPHTEIFSRVGQVGSVMRELGRCVAGKIELSQEAKLSVFRAVFVPVLTYDHEIWVMTERIRSRIQASK